MDEGKPAVDDGMCGGAITVGRMSSVLETSQVGSQMCWPGAQRRGLGSHKDSRLFFKAWQGGESVPTLFLAQAQSLKRLITRQTLVDMSPTEAVQEPGGTWRGQCHGSLRKRRPEGAAVC